MVSKCKRPLLVVPVAAIIVVLVWASMPYWLPTSIALGPCGQDWTSPTSYQPRSSPTRAVDLRVGEVEGKVCYGSPSARGREIFGALVPWDELWRTGANEPTRLFVDGDVDVAGVALPAGRYSLYTIPGRERWQLFVTSSTFHWGNQITSQVRAREVGSAELTATATTDFVEQMTMDWEPKDADSGLLVLEWEDTRLEIPIAAGLAGRSAARRLDLPPDVQEEFDSASRALVDALPGIDVLNLEELLESLSDAIEKSSDTS